MTSVKRPRILQFGTIGQLGLELIRAAAAYGVDLELVTLEQADFTRPDDVARAVDRAGAVDAVVNAAAYTAVDKAESQEELAHIINASTVGVLAAACARRGLPLVHVSTDYVFDGTKASPYREDDATNPLSAYGRTKLAGEIAIREALDWHVIVRTSWVYSVYGANFIKTMLRLGAERDVLKVVDDQWGAPTCAADLAEAVLSIVKQLAAAPQADHFGIFHYTGGGETTWRRFAEQIFAFSAGWAKMRCRVEPIASEDYPLPAPRPRNSRLDCSKIKRTYGVDVVPWPDALKKMLDELRTQSTRGQ